jgi:hypothetical protein
MGVKGVSKYPDVDLNAVIFCACGCGQRIVMKKWMKYQKCYQLYSFGILLATKINSNGNQ